MNAQQGQFESAGHWLLKCLKAFMRTQSPHHVEMARMVFLSTYQQAPPAAQATLKAMWSETELGPFPEDQEAP